MEDNLQLGREILVLPVEFLLVKKVEEVKVEELEGAEEVDVE